MANMTLLFFFGRHSHEVYFALLRPCSCIALIENISNYLGFLCLGIDDLYVYNTLQYNGEHLVFLIAGYCIMLNYGESVGDLLIKHHWQYFKVR